MSQPYDVVGYTYQGETYTPEGMLQVYRGSLGESQFDRITMGYTDTDQAIYFLSSELGFDFDDEDSYDSSQFPKRVFRDQASPSTILTTASDVRAGQRAGQALQSAIMSLFQH